MIVHSWYACGAWPIYTSRYPTPTLVISLPVCLSPSVSILQFAKSGFTPPRGRFRGMAPGGLLVAPTWGLSVEVYKKNFQGG